MCRYLFVRCDNEPAPWSSDGEWGGFRNGSAACRPLQLPPSLVVSWLSLLHQSLKGKAQQASWPSLLHWHLDCYSPGFVTARSESTSQPTPNPHKHNLATPLPTTPCRLQRRVTAPVWRAAFPRRRRRR